MNNEQIKECWQRVFPNSLILIRKSCLGDSIYFNGFLAKDKTEVYNGYFENDMLDYMFEIEEGNYIEHSCSVMIKPENNYLAYSRDKLRKKNIKDITPEKLLKRFEQVKELIFKNRDNFINLSFDINIKI